MVFAKVHRSSCHWRQDPPFWLSPQRQDPPFWLSLFVVSVDLFGMLMPETGRLWQSQTSARRMRPRAIGGHRDLGRHGDGVRGDIEAVDGTPTGGGLRRPWRRKEGAGVPRPHPERPCAFQTPLRPAKRHRCPSSTHPLRMCARFGSARQFREAEEARQARRRSKYLYWRMRVRP